MKIFRHEKELEQKITAADKTTASLVVPISISDDKIDIFINSLKDIEKQGCENKQVGKMVAAMANEPHPDLMYGSAILVSTVVNKNDDMFLPTETWDARNTPIHTPYNDDHVESDIIGHIFASRPLDSEGQLIEADTPPNYFDLEVDFVMYKGIFPAIAKDIQEKAPKGEKFVSMEAKFNNFDYGLYEPDLKAWRIVSRNDETSFLTKSLKVYGGEGTYQDKRVVRVPRNFRFVGMGSVEKPANPASEYTRFAKYEFASQNSVIGETGPDVVLYVTKGKTMTIKNLEEAQQIIADLTKKVEAYESKEGQNTVAALENEKKTLQGQVTSEQEKTRLAQEELKTVKAELEQAKKDLETKTGELKAKQEALAKIEKDKATAERLNKLQEVGYPITDQKKTEIADWSEQTFASIYDFAKSLKSDKKDDKGTAGVAAATTDAQKTLDGVKEDKKTDVTNTSGDSAAEGDKLQKAAAKLSEVLANSRKNKSGSKSNKKE
jgi:nucleotide-binding universal stress UspA family protein